MTTEAIIEILGIVFAAGMFYAKMESISKDIKRLEAKQDKYNNLQERTHDLEIWQKYHEEQHKQEVHNEHTANSSLYVG